VEPELPVATETLEDVMKYTALVLVAALAAAATLRAAPREAPEAARIAKAEKNYAACLDTRNDGVIVSTLAHIALLKGANPDLPLAVLRSSVEEVAATSPSRAVRYRAYLTLMVFTAPELLAGTTLNRADPETVFGAIADRLHESLLSSAE
jgi:hypothetical protein